MKHTSVYALYKEDTVCPHLPTIQMETYLDIQLV